MRWVSPEQMICACWQQFCRARRNLTLVLRARAAYDLIGCRRITWTRVDSHTNQLLNGRADALANAGREGLLSASVELFRQAQMLLA